MKNTIKLFRVIALVAVIGFSMACSVGDNGITTVSVTGVELNKNSISLSVGNTETLTATVSPSNAANKTIGWSSNNPNVATVTYGTITALSLGTATITVTTADGGKTAICYVTVTGGGNKTLVSISVKIQPYQTQYILGEEGLKTEGMVVTATYGDGTTQTVTGYTTSGYNKNQIGNQTITVTYQGKTDTFTINVIDPAKQTVATPTASPSGGMVGNDTRVTLSTTTSDAEIWYTTNGSTPSKNGIGSTKYTSPFYIIPPLTVNAIAVKDGMNDSGILEAVYTLTPILKAEIEITAPTYGGTPATAISSYANNFYAGTVTWSPNDYQFLPNAEYTATVTLMVRSGASSSSFTFIGLTETTVNGQTAIASNNTGGTVTLTYKFPATGAKIVTDITISSQPYKLNYTHGDTLDLMGLGVTLFYNTADPATNSEYVHAYNFSDKGITANPSAGNNLVRSIHNGKPITITYGSFSKTTANLAVDAKNVSALTIEAIQAHTYTGSEILPVITVKDGAATLRLDEDYTATYTNNINTGIATVTINGIGNYTGSRTVSFTINRANPSVTWPTVMPITYGTALSEALSGGASTTAGTFALNVSSWNYPNNVGTYTYILTFTPTDTNNYNTIFNEISITVTTANLSGTIAISPVGPVRTGTELTATYTKGDYEYDLNLSYQWKKDGDNVGTNSNKFTPTQPGSYTVTVSARNYNSKQSATVTVAIFDLSGTITINPVGPVNIYTQLIATYSGSEIVSYQWKKDGNNVGTDRYYYTPTTPGSYTVTVSVEGYNSKTSAAVSIVNVWTPVTTSVFGTSSINSIAYGNNKFVASSYDKIATSTDGVTWTATNNTFGKSLSDITYGNNKFVAFFYSSDNNGFRVTNTVTSSDGTTWTAVADNTFGSAYISAITYGNNKFVAGNMNGEIFTSIDGVTWTKVNVYSIGEEISAIAYGNNIFVASGWWGKMATSTDGTTWATVTDKTLGNNYIRAIAYGNGKFVTVGVNGKIFTSIDGTTWTAATTNPFDLSGDYINKIVYGNNKFIAVSSDGKLATSTDGVTWKNARDGVLEVIEIYGVAYGNNKFVVVGKNGEIAYSPDNF